MIPPLPHPDVELTPLYHSGKYQKLLDCHRENYVHLSQIYDFDHKYIGIAISNLADGYVNLGDYAAAERELHRGIVPDVKNCDDLRERNLAFLTNLAHLYLRTRQEAKAEQVLARAEIIMDEMAIVPRKWRAAAKLHQSRIKSRRGELADAQRLLNEAVELTERDVKSVHGKFGNMLDHLSELYERQDRIPEAEQAIRKALDAHIVTETPVYAHALLQLGRLRAAQGDVTEARTSLKRALDIVRRVRPPDHSDISDIEERLASLDANECS